MLWRGVFPTFNQILHNDTLACFGVRRVLGQIDVGLRNIDERLCALPVARLICDIKVRNGFGRNAFALHLVHQSGKAVSKVIKRCARSKALLAFEQIGDKLYQFQTTLKCGIGFRYIKVWQQILDLVQHSNAGQ